jgi:DNA-directed RNA polymerase sigma subunit (sigma70/sigma32)
MREALGIRGTRIRAEHNAVSLDKPLSGSEDFSLLDTIKDDSLPDTGETLLLNDLRRQVRAEVKNLNSNHAADIIYAHDIDGRSYQEISEETGISKNYIPQIRAKGFKELRKSPTLFALISLDERTRYYAHKGYRAFSSSWSSVVEDAVIWRLEQYYSE